jgi:hypothetical protein
MKIIKIEKCQECDDFESEMSGGYCWKTNKSFEIGEGFPDWCPLEDAPSDEIGPCEHEWEPCNAVQCENCGLIVED